MTIRDALCAAPSTLLVLLLAAAGWPTTAAASPAEAGTAANGGYRVETPGKLVIAGKPVHYRALVEESFLAATDGQRAASVVSTSYLREDVDTKRERPVVFVFNGGPGSAGLWLQMGLVGPRRVDLDDVTHPPTVPPYGLVDNDDSLLDVADVVIFDPPGTGLSRVLEGAKPDSYFGVTQDAEATVQFIGDWIERHRRWNSPRFLMGESYGTIRAAVVAKLLAGGPFGTGSMDALTLNGVILLGQSMDFAGDGFGHANDLPALAAAAWYHAAVDHAGTTLERHVAAAREFADRDYLAALQAGSRLSEEQRQDVAERMSRLIGLPAPLILEQDLRISGDFFSKHLLAASGLQVGKYDARFVLPLSGSGGDPVADDPAMAQYVPAFVTGMNVHLHDELGVTLDRPYLPIEFMRVNSRWDYGMGPGVPSRTNYAADLATAMRRNPALKLFVGTGYYDLVTTIGDADYVLAHSGIPPERVTQRNYESGHMPYLGHDSRKILAADLRRFIQEASHP